jgi:hypothetical protein
MVSSCCCDVDENRALLGYYALSSGNSLPMFPKQLMGAIFKGQESKKKVKEVTNRLYQNIGKKLALLAA